MLEKIWEGLCLPEEELFKYLSLCRMYTWTQIHWLKLFSVMVGSMNDVSFIILYMALEKNVSTFFFLEC